MDPNSLAPFDTWIPPEFLGTAVTAVCPCVEGCLSNLLEKERWNPPLGLNGAELGLFPGFFFWWWNLWMEEGSGLWKTPLPHSQASSWSPLLVKCSHYRRSSPQQMSEQSWWPHSWSWGPLSVSLEALGLLETKHSTRLRSQGSGMCCFDPDAMCLVAFHSTWVAFAFPLCSEILRNPLCHQLLSCHGSMWPGLAPTSEQIPWKALEVQDSRLGGTWDTI